MRPITSCPTRRPVNATTDSGRTSGESQRIGTSESALEQAAPRAGGGGQSGSRVRFGQGFGGAGSVNIEDLFGDIFSGGGGFGPIPGADQEAVLDLTVEEAYRGGRRQISLNGRSYT